MNKLLSVMVAAAFAVLSLSSCSLLAGKTTTTTASARPTATAPSASTDNSAAGKPSTASGKTHSASGKTHSASGKTQSAASSAASSLAGMLNGEWTIVAVGNKAVVRDDEMPYINFEEAASRFYASNSCNVINGFYSLSGNEIHWQNVLSTLRECPDVHYADAITRALADGTAVKAKIDKTGSTETLTLSSLSNKNLLTLKKQSDTESLNGQWTVAAIDGNAINDPEVNLFIDMAEHKVHGNTGCNFFNGSILSDPHLANSIQFSQMGVTMRMCPNLDTERQLLVALESTTSYKFSGKTLVFINDKGHAVLSLSKE